MTESNHLAEEALTQSLRVDKITGTAREFVMLRRAVDFLKAVPSENMGADLNAALVSINEYYNTQPATENITLDLRAAPEGVNPNLSTDVTVINGVTVVGANGVAEFNALKAFGELVKAALNSSSLSSDENNALVEFKNFYSL